MIIYGIIDTSSGEVVYIGKTRNLMKRTGTHRNAPGEIGRWFRERIKEGAPPDVKELERTTARDAGRRERKWVVSIGIENLRFNKRLPNLNTTRTGHQNKVRNKKTGAVYFGYGEAGAMAGIDSATIRNMCDRGDTYERVSN